MENEADGIGFPLTDSRIHILPSARLIDVGVIHSLGDDRRWGEWLCVVFSWVCICDVRKTAYFQGIRAYLDCRKERRGAEWGGQQSIAEKMRREGWRIRHGGVSHCVYVHQPASQPASLLRSKVRRTF